MRGTAGRPFVHRVSRGWRVTFYGVDLDDRRRVFSTLHDTWSDALDHAHDLAALGA